MKPGTDSGKFDTINFHLQLGTFKISITFVPVYQRILALFLLLVFVYNSVGYYIVFSIEQYRIKKEVKRKIIHSVPENELTVVSFHPTSKEFLKIDWVEDYEFRYKEEMYDVVYQDINTDGTIAYHCIKDTQEEVLFANLEEHIQNHTKTNKSGNATNKSTFGKVVVKDYFFQDNPIFFLGSCERIRFSFPFSCPDAITLDVDTPPPNKSLLT